MKQASLKLLCQGWSCLSWLKEQCPCTTCTIHHPANTSAVQCHEYRKITPSSFRAKLICEAVQWDQSSQGQPSFLTTKKCIGPKITLDPRLWGVLADLPAHPLWPILTPSPTAFFFFSILCAHAPCFLGSYSPPAGCDRVMLPSHCFSSSEWKSSSKGFSFSLFYPFPFLFPVLSIPMTHAILFIFAVLLLCNIAFLAHF